MLAENERVLGVAEPHQRGTQDGPGSQVKGPVRLGRDDPVPFGVCLRTRHRTQVHQAHRYSARRVDDLPWYAVDHGEASPQHLMPFGQVTERRGEGAAVYGGRPVDPVTDVVSRVVRLQLV